MSFLAFSVSVARPEFELAPREQCNPHNMPYQPRNSQAIPATFQLVPPHLRCYLVNAGKPLSSLPVRLPDEAASPACSPLPSEYFDGLYGFADDRPAHAIGAG